MAKVFLVAYGFCRQDYSAVYKTAEEASKHFAPGLLFVDAPDYVFESWGYDETKTGDERFIKPTTPEGFVYEDNSGTFYREESPREKREREYSVERNIGYNDELYSVDELNSLWLKYKAEGDDIKSSEISGVIANAKAEIREKYPDE